MTTLGAAQIAGALGGARRSSGWWRCRCPVHNSRGSTLALRDGDRSLIVRCWAGCDPRDILGELRRRGLVAGRAEDRSVISAFGAEPRDDTALRIALGQRIWRAAKEARGSPVAAYLAGRGILIDPPPALRWVPSLRRPDGSSDGAMVARVDDVDGQLVGLQRTWLTRDKAGEWRRCDRASLGPIGGGAVRLSLAAETLMVSEGIETALAAMTATAMPAWAALSTSGMAALVLPPRVRQVIILADNDKSGAGERAASAAAQRWLVEGRRVRIAMPPQRGTDFNDLLLGRAYAQKEAHDVAA